MTRFMFPLFESIKVREGQFVNLDGHQRRLNKSRKALYSTPRKLELEPILKVPDDYKTGIVKCRVSYGVSLGPVEFSDYNLKVVNSLQLVESAPFDYGLKYQDRSILDQIYQLRGSCDEVLISIDGYICDTSYSNVALFDGSNWYTPERPLLRGTQRDKLLKDGVLQQARISTVQNWEILKNCY